MEKLIERQPALYNRWKFKSVYKEQQINDFWKGTDKKTQRAVEETAHAEQSEEYRQRVVNKLPNDYRRYLSKCSEEELEVLLLECLRKANDGRYQHDSDNSRSARIRSGTSKFLNSFHNYTQSFSAIIQIMNGAGQGYGDAAYGALSIFLLVAVNKEKTEDVISEMLSKLQEQYSRIRRLESVYAKADIKQHIALVYKLGIEFTNEAALYYSRGTFKRFLYLLTRPPSIALEIKVGEIEKAIKDLEDEMNTQDRIRLKSVEAKLDDVQDELTLLQDSVDVGNTREENRRLKSVKDLLQVEGQEVKTFVHDYNQLLLETFGNLRRLPPFEVEREFLLRDNFKRWRSSDDPGIMVLCGKTIAPDRTLLSWHSTATTRVVLEPTKYVQGKDKTQPLVLLHCFCQAVDNYGEDAMNRHNYITVILVLVYQLLELPAARLLASDDEQHAKLERNIKELTNQQIGNKPSTVLERQFDIFETLLVDFQLGKAFIVLDRIDRLNINVELFLGSLVNLINRSRKKCILKALVTVGGKENVDNCEVSGELSQEMCKIVVFDQDN